MTNSKGYTLIELIVVMGIFIGVLLLTTSAFENMLKKTGQQMKSAESQIEGIIGLEMLRYDVEHAGYGLPWAYSSTFTPDFNELDASPLSDVNATMFSDDPASGVVPPFPRSVVAGMSTTTGYDYLVVKSVLTPVATYARRWSYVNYSSSPTVGNVSFIKKWGRDTANVDAGNDVQERDRVVTLNTTFTTLGAVTKQLVTDGDTFFYTIGSNTSVITGSAAFKPDDATRDYVVYTIANNSDPVFPYNRADYFVERPSTIPSACNSGTGILYKATASNKSGVNPTKYPLLDCVGDLQVVLNLDMNDDGIADTLASPSNVVSSLTGNDKTSFTTSGAATALQVRDTTTNAALLRQRLKLVQVYILAHEGKRDPGFTYPSSTITVGPTPFVTDLGRQWTASAMTTKFGADWMNYRWKVYSLIIRPKNLN
jgi:type II secretory pathway pseudopilin PulG